MLLPKRVRVFSFVLFWTVIIFGYVALLTVVDESTLESLYKQVPPMQYIGVTLGVHDTTQQYDSAFQERKSLSSRLQQLIAWQQAGKDTGSDYWLSLRDERTSLRLYSPIYTFAGEVSPGAERIEIIFSHRGRELTKTLPVKSFSPGDRHWEHQVSLGKESMFNGRNTYLIRVIYQDGEQLERRVTIHTDYQRIELGETVLFLDPHYIPPGKQEDILREANDFEGIASSFVTYGCDPEIAAPPVLVEHDLQYRQLPACFTFSMSKRYLLSFKFTERQQDAYLFDIVRANGELLYPNYPLYTIEFGTVYLGLPFWDQGDRLLKTIRMHGDSLRYLLTVVRYDVDQHTEMFRLQHVDGHTLRVETPREKLLVYMYKDWDNYQSLIYPGMRYQFFIKSRGNTRKKINEGTLAVSSQRIYGPAREERATFVFDVIIDGDLVTLDDGFHLVTFDLTDIGGTLDAGEKQPILDQPNLCDQVVLDMYSDYDGRKAEQIYLWEDAYLVGKGLLASEIKIFHNGETTGSPPDWQYKGHIYHPVAHQQQNLVSGENIYTIVLYDSRGVELCRKELRLQAVRG